MDFPLSPILHPRVRQLVEGNSTELFKLAEFLGSPLHIVFPQIMMETAEQFCKTLDSYGSGGTVFFAAKANKSNAFLAASAVMGIGADVSSTQELMGALSSGVRGDRISVSGPTKPPALLALAILHNARIAIDEPSELETIVEIATNLPIAHKVRVFLRMSASDTSRFGMTPEVIDEIISRLAKLQSQIELEGFSFHAASYESEDRQALIAEACKAIERAHAAGLTPTHINTGGGLRNVYARSEDWSLKQATEREFAGGVKPLFVYPYATGPGGYSQLKQILDASKSEVAATAKSIGQPVVIDMEPGRSLLDQAGVSIFRVRAVRPIGERWQVVVDGSSRDLAEFWRNSEFFLDPMLVTMSPRKAEPFDAAIASNTCLESDYLARRFIPLPSKPEQGDLLVFVNTAGYQMDSKQSEFHRMPLATKVVGLQKVDGWHFIDDTRISAADLMSVSKKSERG